MAINWLCQQIMFRWHPNTFTALSERIFLPALRGNLSDEMNVNFKMLKLLVTTTRFLLGHIMTNKSSSLWKVNCSIIFVRRRGNFLRVDGGDFWWFHWILLFEKLTSSSHTGYKLIHSNFGELTIRMFLMRHSATTCRKTGSLAYENVYLLL